MKRSLFSPFLPSLACLFLLSVAAPLTGRGQTGEEMDPAPKALAEEDRNAQKAEEKEEKTDDKDQDKEGDKEPGEPGKEQAAAEDGEVEEPAPLEEVKIAPAGIRVVARQYGDGLTALRPFNWSRGTTLALLVTREEGGLIAFDEHASKLERFRDSQGNDLTKSDEPAGRHFVSYTRVSSDGKAVIPEVRAPGVPAAGTRDVEAKGTLVLRVATRKETFRNDRTPLKVGSKIEAGPVPLEIVEIGKPSYGNAALNLTLQAADSLDSLESVRFVDDKGKEIPSRPAGAHNWTAFGKTHATRTFTLETGVSEATVELTHWTDVREVEAPFQVTVPLGL